MRSQAVNQKLETRNQKPELKILVVGPTPPPFHGVATFTRDLLQAGSDGVFGNSSLEPAVAGEGPALRTACQLFHLDTSDRRDASNLGRWDGRNLQLGFANLAELAARCVRSRVDIVYIPISQSVPGFLRDGLFMLQARLLGARVVAHLHGGYFRRMYEAEANGLARPFIRLALRCASAAIVLAPEFRGLLEGLVPAGRVHVVENGVPDPGAWERRSKRGREGEAGAGSRHASVLYMGTLTRTKGIFELVQAFAELQARRPVRLDVAGDWQDGALREEALRFVHEMRLEAQVCFHGNVVGEAKARLLAEADLLCLPTRYPYEGQPLVILEAFAAGLPVLSTRHAAIASTVGETDETGASEAAGELISPEATPGQLASKLDEMLASPEKLRLYGEHARRRYLERYSLEACHRRLFDVFCKAGHRTAGVSPV